MDRPPELKNDDEEDEPERGINLPLVKEEEEEVDE